MLLIGDGDDPNVSSEDVYNGENNADFDFDADVDADADILLYRHVVLLVTDTDDGFSKEKGDDDIDDGDLIDKDSTKTIGSCRNCRIANIRKKETRVSFLLFVIVCFLF